MKNVFVHAYERTAVRYVCVYEETVPMYISAYAYVYDLVQHRTLY
jgi:hypothetical protein